MKVYVVTYGEYSESGIIGVFARKEDADEVAAARNKHAHHWLGYGVSEWDVRGEAIDPPKWYVRVYRSSYKGAPWRLDELKSPDTDFYVGKDSFYPSDEDDVHDDVTVWIEVDPETYDERKSRRKFIKIAQDRHAQWKAEQAGVA
jgi:hypothetical protein